MTVHDDLATVLRGIAEPHRANNRHEYQEAVAAHKRVEAEVARLTEQVNGWCTCAEDADGVLFVTRAEAAEAEVARLDLARGALMFPDVELGAWTDAELLHVAKRFKPAERRVRVAAWRSFFKWAIRTRRVDRNPCDQLPDIRKPAVKVPRVFTEAECEALLALDVVDAAPLAVLLEAGLRKAEARHLRLRDCTPESGQVIVVQGKGGKDRIVPMSARLRAMLTDLAILEGLGPNDHIFYGVRANQRASQRIRTQPVGEGTFARWWRKCLDEAGVLYRTPHTARHTFATAWRRRGLQVDELQLLLGHASIRTTSDLYVHTAVHDVAEHMALIEAGEI